MAMSWPGLPYCDNGANGDNGDSMATMVIQWRSFVSIGRQWIANGSPMDHHCRHYRTNVANGAPFFWWWSWPWHRHLMTPLSPFKWRQWWPMAIANGDGVTIGCIRHWRQWIAICSIFCRHWRQWRDIQFVMTLLPNFLSQNSYRYEEERTVFLLLLKLWSLLKN